MTINVLPELVQVKRILLFSAGTGGAKDLALEMCTADQEERLKQPEPKTKRFRPVHGSGFAEQLQRKR
jgi:hypothetical protein